MSALAALYRHPVKGFTPEPLGEAILEAGGWFPGDRMWAVEDGPSGFDPEAPVHLSKTRFTVLMRDASLARIRTHWDQATGVWTVAAPDRAPMAVRLANAGDRAAFEAMLGDYLGETVAGPLRLIPAGSRHRFMDSKRGRVSILNLASVRDLEARLGHPVDPRRFRANLWVEGWAPWIENTLVGERVNVGETVLRGDKPIVRCAATHVDPDSGVRDLDLVAGLFHHYGHVLCGLYVSIETGGRMTVGDIVERVP